MTTGTGDSFLLGALCDALRLLGSGFASNFFGPQPQSNAKLGNATAKLYQCYCKAPPKYVIIYVPDQMLVG
ncbi:MAG: hypothetical protein ABL962_05125 [Fimbriimonadaceae bacterium]